LWIDPSLSCGQCIWRATPAGADQVAARDEPLGLKAEQVHRARVAQSRSGLAPLKREAAGSRAVGFDLRTGFVGGVR
jgi:hypothetical protein